MILNVKGFGVMTAILAVVIAAAIIGGVTAWWYTTSETNEISCPYDGSPYVWTQIGSRSENFNWVCLQNGHTWVKSYPEDVYQEWCKAFLQPEDVRNYIMLYLRIVENRQNLPDPLGIAWTGGRETPEDLLGSETYVYKAEGVVVTIKYLVVLPENIIYRITVESQGTLVWEGQLQQRQFTQQMTRLASVNGIEINLLESFPVQVNVVVRGKLPDSCTEVYEITQRREGNAFFITITTIRPADAICAQVITPFEKVVALNVVGLKAGIYTVNVNGVNDKFELQIDNITKTEGIEVEVGQEFTITLESNPTTGYQWQLAKPLDESTLKFVGSEYVPPKTDLLGAGGKEVWTFKAVSNGTTEISLQYIRPWENNVLPTNTQTFTIIVK